MAKKRRRLTPAGRAVLAVSGRANLKAWRELHGRSQPDVTAEVEQFHADLLRDLGPKRTAAQTALAVSAVASYASILLALSKLLRTRRSRRLGAFLDRLSRLQGQLLRTLRQLFPAIGDGLDPDTPPADASLEERQAWSKQYVKSRIEGSTKP
jgi:predicted cobalt transporter CbtA